MGKRELLIICAFIVVGAMTYQFTASPPKPGERSFSISDMFRGIRREISSNASSARVVKNDTIVLPAGTKELQITTARSVPLTIIGEHRDDVAYEMAVRSTGPDEATAKEWAGKVDLRRDQLGSTVSLSTYFPPEGTQRAELLTLRVPRHLAVRVEGSTRIQVSEVAGVDLRNPSGEVTLTEVGAVTGSHRSGDLVIAGAHRVDLSLVSSRAKIRNVGQGVTLNARNGECSITESTGDIVASISNAELTVGMFKNSLKVTGDGGRLRVLDAQNRLSVDARRTLVELEASTKGSDELTVVTTDEPIRLSLDRSAAASIDALTRSGNIRAQDFGWEPIRTDTESRLTADTGKAGARIVLRNTRGDIVIGKRK